MNTNIAKAIELNALGNEKFNFEEHKVQTITMEQLRRTYKENDVYGEPLKGIYHYQLIDNITAYCREAGFTPEIYDLFAAQNKDRSQPGVVVLPQAEDKYGEGAVEAHILRRVYANIRLRDFDNDEMTTNLAVAFHQRGIQVGFGRNVKICHNQCMLSPTHYVSTYSEKGNGRESKMTIEMVLQTVIQWLQTASETIHQQDEKIRRMKETLVTAEQLFTLIGMLTAIRVKCDSKNKLIRETAAYPLNSAQINQFTEDMLVKRAEGKDISVWDVYNSATNLYHADQMEIPNLLTQNRSMVNLLNSTFPI